MTKSAAPVVARAEIQTNAAASSHAIRKPATSPYSEVDRAGGPGSLPPQPEMIPVEAGAVLQRKCACQGSDGSDEDDRGVPLQRRPSGSATPGSAPPVVDSVLAGSGKPLPAELGRFFGRRFGFDFGSVRLHTDGEAEHSAREVGAQAYTVGNHIVFGHGRYQPGTPRGRHLLAHELAHTVQQRGSNSVRQSRLEIGAADSPLETAADRAADAVLGGRQVPVLAPIGPLLSRQVADSHTTETPGECTETPSGASVAPRISEPGPPMGGYSILRVERVSDHQRRVHLGNGERFLVERIPYTTFDETGPSHGGATPGMDTEQVWLDIEYCGEGSDFNVRIGADLPHQVIQLVENAISSGGDVDSAWNQASLTPNLHATIHPDRSSRAWDFSVHTTVDSQGRDTGVGGEVTYGTDTPEGRFEVGVGAESREEGGNPFAGVDLTGIARFTPGASETPRHCEETHHLRARIRYECQHEWEDPPQSHPGTQEVAIEDERIYNIFFQYRLAAFDEPRNRQTWRDLARDLAPGAGFQVLSIEGWTSPEGPLGPGSGRFQGNTVLSQQRAEAARSHIASLRGIAPDSFAPGAEVVGLGERMDPLDETGQPQDISGDPLEEHVDRTFATDPGESTVQSPALAERLHRTGTAHERAERIYPQLRRAVVTLHRTRSRTDPCSVSIPGSPQARGAACPDQIRLAAFPESGT